MQFNDFRTFNTSLYLSSFMSKAVIDLNIWTQIINEMKNGLWNLFLVLDPNENNDNPILYKWFSAHLIAITDAKDLFTSKSFIIDSVSMCKWKNNILYNLIS
jgi:hypothetical protein